MIKGKKWNTCCNASSWHLVERALRCGPHVYLGFRYFPLGRPPEISRAILGGWVRTDRAFSGVRGLNFTKLGQDIVRSSQHCTFSEFGYLAAFSNAGGSKLSDVWNDATCRTFWPHVKNKRRGGRDPYTICWNFTYDRTSKILMAVFCVAAKHGGLIKK